MPVGLVNVATEKSPSILEVAVGFPTIVVTSSVSRLREQRIFRDGCVNVNSPGDR
jgi:hypothetical protein